MPADTSRRTLYEFGFLGQEISRCASANNAFLLIPATVNGAEARLLLDTGAVEEVALEMTYAEQNGLPIYDEHVDSWGERLSDPPMRAAFFNASAINACGQTLTNRQVRVANFAERYGKIDRVDGILGATFFSGGTLGIDPPNALVGFSHRSLFPMLEGSATHVLHLTQTGGVFSACTRDFKDGVTAREQHLIVLLDTGTDRSFLTTDYLLEKSPKIVRWAVRYGLKTRRLREFSRGFPYFVIFPTGERIELRVSAMPPMVDPTTALGVSQIDGILGMDVLREFISIWDFVEGVVALYKPIRHTAS